MQKTFVYSASERSIGFGNRGTLHFPVRSACKIILNAPLAPRAL